MVLVTSERLLARARLRPRARAQRRARRAPVACPSCGSIARREASVVEAAVPPLVALLLGALGVLSTSAAVWTAFVLGLVVLGAQGIVFARFERLGATATIGVVAANLGLGLVLVGLKVLVTH